MCPCHVVQFLVLHGSFSQNTGRRCGCKPAEAHSSSESCQEQCKNALDHWELEADSRMADNSTDSTICFLAAVQGARIRELRYGVLFREAVAIAPDSGVRSNFI